jgi:uncharacterized protein
MSIQLHVEKIASELNLKVKQVFATAELLEQEATIPFIARYRKEVTGSLDEVNISDIRNGLIRLEELDKRRDAILKSLEERELLTEELKEKIISAESLTELEDIYLPFRPKRRTRATIAKEKGLEPLALKIYEQEDFDVTEFAKTFINPDLGVNDTEEALSGARDIIAEWVSENKEGREKLRELVIQQAFIYSKVFEESRETALKYKDYFDWKEHAYKAPSHRILAIFRGENEGFLKVDIYPEEETALSILKQLYVKTIFISSKEVELAVVDSYKRLLGPAMETEFRGVLKEKADKEAISVFADNLKQLLLAAPLGQKRIIALDPGFRTGCKLVCLDRQGKPLHNETIYPHTSDKQRKLAGETLISLYKKFEIEAIAIGNGTASRETETFVKSAIPEKGLSIVMVNESGASIYSASDVARKEFPDYDITVRGAVSIGRRLMDPLAELVKIDPKSIGVGQYQHDVNQSALKGKLDDVVISCVNAVGVELNTASKELLTYVSGLGPKLAQNIVEYRNENGAFNTRDGIKKVPRLGEKAFIQAAGFLRIKEGINPLDKTAVHPESYFIVEKMAEDLNVKIEDLICKKELIEKIDLNKYISDSIGLPTLEDIKAELLKPGRDPRKEFETFQFTEGVEKIEDLKPGMKLPGVVTNITNFGVFVDIGVHQDGLVHISQITDKFIQNPLDVLKVHQKVTATVLEVDIIRKRIKLSLKGSISAPEKKLVQKKKESKTVEDPMKKLLDKFKKYNNN